MTIALRQTILNNYEKCPFMTKEIFGTLDSPLEYIDNEEHKNKYASCGVALHEAMEYWGKKKIEGIDVPCIDVHDCLDSRFALIPPKLFDNADDKDKYYNSLHEQIDWLYDKSHLITPIACELNFTLDNLIDGLPAFTGTIDRIDGSIANQDVDLVDYKTGKNYTKKELSCNMQAAIYSLAFYKLFNFMPKRFVFLFSKSKAVKIIHINDEFLYAAIGRIRGLYYNMAQGDYTPNNQNKYFCNNFCEKQIKNKCPLMGKNRTPWDEIADTIRK